MSGAGSELAARVLSEVRKFAEVELVDIEDDDVFLDQVPNAEVIMDNDSNVDVYSDMASNGNEPQTVEEVRKALADDGGCRRRRTSDVIDSLGDEVIHRHSFSTDPCVIPVSPRNRISSDLGYGGSFASSPSATNFNYSPINYGLRTGGTVTDSRPINLDRTNAFDGPKESYMPVSRDSEAYNMNHSRRGRAVIFNNDSFEDNMVTPRKGSQIDVERLEKTLGGLGFEVTIFDNLTYYEIKEVVLSLSREDHTHADCILIAVLTHGLDNGLLYARDALYKVESIWQPFAGNACLTLAGKPKLFFIQACRGDKLDEGVTLVSQRRSASETDTGSPGYRIPNLCDFLISFSSMEGYYSWRNPEEGTWFIQSLSAELNKCGKEKNLIDILTRVHRRVALDYQSEVDGFPMMTNQKQCPVYHSTLMRDLVFFPKEQE